MQVQDCKLRRLTAHQASHRQQCALSHLFPRVAVERSPPPSDNTIQPLLTRKNTKEQGVMMGNITKSSQEILRWVNFQQAEYSGKNNPLCVSADYQIGFLDALALVEKFAKNNAYAGECYLCGETLALVDGDDPTAIVKPGEGRLCSYCSRRFQELN